MAKKGSVNKSQAIRDYSAANPEAKPRAIAAALKKQGVNVTPEFVSTVRSNDKRNHGNTGRGRKLGMVNAGGKGAISQAVPLLIQAKKMADLLGGTRKAREALDALDELS